MNIEQWVIDWFTENVDVEKDELINNIESNYFHEGWIDSFKFMSFIEDIEEEFDIAFDNEEFQNRNFAVLKGLIEIISSKLNGQV